MSERYRVIVPDVEFWKRMIPCQAACPVHTDAGKYVQLIAEGEFEKAYLTARSPNPFASVCGRVCAAPCEDFCRRGQVDAPVSIRALKRFVAVDPKTGEMSVGWQVLMPPFNVDSVGPSQPESSQLIDISGEKMKLLYDAFTEPEPQVIWDVVNQGDKVIIHLANIEQTTDERHGFAIGEYNINVVVDPGETETIEFVARKPGVFPYYCTNFCSALHQEMQGYLLVKPRS